MLERLERRVSRQLGKGHEAGPAWHERNGGGDRMYPVTSERRLHGSSKGSSGDGAFMKCQETGFGALWRTELKAPERQHGAEGLVGLPGMPSERPASEQSVVTR